MDTSLASVFDLYVFPTGRRLFALGQMMKRGQALGFEPLVKHCKAAITQDRACLALEGQWAGSAYQARQYGTGADAAQKVDINVDRTLTAIRDRAESETAGAPPDDPIHATVATFLRAVFPAGVQAVTALPYVEELSAVDQILQVLRSKTHAPTVKELGLERIVARLESLAAEYRAVLEKPSPATVGWGQVRAARAAGQERLLQAVALVVGRYHGSSEADVAARADLLGPIVAQQAALAASLRVRRPIEDVDPETGAPAPNAPDAAPPAPVA